MNSTLRVDFLTAAVALLQHGDNTLERVTAAGVLGTLGDATVISALLAALQTDPSRKVRHKAAQSLVRIGGEAAQQGLQDIMRTENTYTRILAAEALADIIARGTTKTEQ